MDGTDHGGTYGERREEIIQSREAVGGTYG